MERKTLKYHNIYAEYEEYGTYGRFQQSNHITLGFGKGLLSVCV